MIACSLQNGSEDAKHAVALYSCIIMVAEFVEVSGDGLFGFCNCCVRFQLPTIVITVQQILELGALMHALNSRTRTVYRTQPLMWY